MHLGKALLGLALAGSLALAACSPMRGIEAALAAGDIAAGEGPSLFKRIAAAPRRSPVAYTVAGRERRGDLYLPADGIARAALVLVPGVTPDGKDDRRLVAVAQTLARARFMVLVPEIARLRSLRVGAEDARDIADAVRHLAGRLPQGQDAEGVGIVAISYAAGPALIAALGEARPHARFLLAVGGYYDMTALIAYVTTGFHRAGPDEPWQAGKPNDYGRWVFLDSNAHHVADVRDRILLMAIAGRKRRDAAADISDLVVLLGEQGRAVHALLDNRDPDRVPALIAALPESLRQEIVALDPSRMDMTGLAAQLLLVHGRDDAIIPWTESAALATAAGPDRSTLFLVDRLAHVELGAGGLRDAWTLWRAVYRLLKLRDDMPDPAPGQAAGEPAAAGL